MLAKSVRIHPFMLQILLPVETQPRPVRFTLVALDYLTCAVIAIYVCMNFEHPSFTVERTS